jgi:hypothetical protein
LGIPITWTAMLLVADVDQLFGRARSEPTAWRFPCKQGKIPLQLLRQGWKTCPGM